MMIVIRIPSMAHKWLEYIWESPVESSVWFGEDSVVVDVVVHHEGETPRVPHRNKQMNDAVKIGEISKEQIQSTRYRGTKVHDDMREEDHICVVADHCPRPRDVIA